MEETEAFKLLLTSLGELQITTTLYQLPMEKIQIGDSQI